MENTPNNGSNKNLFVTRQNVSFLCLVYMKDITINIVFRLLFFPKPRDTLFSSISLYLNTPVLWFVKQYKLIHCNLSKTESSEFFCFLKNDKAKRITKHKRYIPILTVFDSFRKFILFLNKNHYKKISTLYQTRPFTT